MFKPQTGDVEVHGDVHYAKTMSGRHQVQVIEGDAKTMSGDITCDLHQRPLFYNEWRHKTMKVRQARKNLPRLIIALRKTIGTITKVLLLEHALFVSTYNNPRLLHALNIAY